MFLANLVYFGLAGKQTPVEVVTDEIRILFFPIDCPEYLSHLEKKKGVVLWGIAVWCSWSTLWRPEKGDTSETEKEENSDLPKAELHRSYLSWTQKRTYAIVIKAT